MQVEDDLSRPEGGHALLVVPGRASEAGTSLTVTVRRFRESDPCLGPNGWQPAEHRFKPRRRTTRGDDLVLVLGPRIVDQVEEFTTVMVGVPEFDLSENLHWPALRPSSGLPGAGLDDEPEEEEEELPPPKAAPKTEPAAVADEGLADAASLLARKDAQEPEAEEPPPPPGPAPEPKKSRWPLFVGLGVLAIAAAVAAFLLIPGEEEILEEDVKKSEETATDDTKADEATDGTADESDTTDETDTADGTTDGTADDTSADETPDDSSIPEPPVVGTPAEVHEEALQALATGDNDEAVRLLRENIEKDDYGPSMVTLGGYYCERDAGEALKLFAQACTAGAEGAADALQTCAGTLKAAAEGDVLVRVILDNELPPAEEACK